MTGIPAPTAFSAICEALDRFTAAWSCPELAGELAERLSCHEVDTLVEVLRAVGHIPSAKVWIDQHAQDDDIGDAHYTGNDEDEQDMSEYMVGRFSQFFRPDDVWEHCREEIEGVCSEHRDALVREATLCVGTIETPFEDWGRVGGTVQSVAARRRYPTVS